MGSTETAESAGRLKQREDHELIADCLQGDHQAWAELITRYRRLIYSIPIKARLSPDDAADIFQSVCLKLYEKLATLREYDKIRSWLITMTTRECWRVAAQRRRESAQGQSDDDDDQDMMNELADTAPLMDEQRETLERQQIVRQAIESLPERCQGLLTMLFYQKEELSYADIARQMKMPVASIGPTRARCLEKLKKLLEGKF